MKNDKKRMLIFWIIVIAIMIALVVFLVIKKEKQPAPIEPQNIPSQPEQEEHHHEAKDYSTLTKEENKQQIENFYQEMNPENKEKVNQQEKVKEEKQIDGLILRNVNMYQETGVIMFMGELYNPTGNNVEGFRKDVVFLDKSGKEIGTMKIGIGKDTLKSDYSYPILSMEREPKFSIDDVYDYVLK